MRPSLLLLPALSLLGCHDDSSRSTAAAPVEEADPPAIVIGERLFREDRFAQFFSANSGGMLNMPLTSGDPVLDTIVLDGLAQPSPFAGLSASCSTCHLVDQVLDLPGGGMRTYNDFNARTPVPDRPGTPLETVRNSPPLVNASIVRDGPTVFHFDGEFATLEELVRDTLIGRNYGWLPAEGAAATAHIAAVIRMDDGQGELAAEFSNLSYAEVLDADNADVPEEFRLPPEFTLTIATATDEELIEAVAKLIATYTEDLAFARDDDDLYSDSPYDLFLARNGLPQAPDMGEETIEYARRLALEIDTLVDPVFISDGVDGTFEFHDEEFAFGPEELDGLRVFLREPAGPIMGTGGIGNCIACHRPPDFTDFRFHNVGFSQAEYDGVHGAGAFALLVVPDLTTRNADPVAFLPATPAQPTALGPFRSKVDISDPSLADLGMWNVFANPAFPNVQVALREIEEAVLAVTPGALTDDQLLAASLGVFKTPGLRDLGHSAPYAHSGVFGTLGDVLIHYVQFSSLARAGFVRNPDPDLANIDIGFADLAPLAALLRSLNEDYD